MAKGNKLQILGGAAGAFALVVGGALSYYSNNSAHAADKSVAKTDTAQVEETQAAVPSTQPVFLVSSAPDQPIQLASATPAKTDPVAIVPAPANTNIAPTTQPTEKSFADELNEGRTLDVQARAVSKNASAVGVLISTSQVQEKSWPAQDIATEMKNSLKKRGVDTEIFVNPNRVNTSQIIIYVDNKLILRTSPNDISAELMQQVVERQKNAQLKVSHTKAEQQPVLALDKN